jgi:excisionase family DNA binding protein
VDYITTEKWSSLEEIAEHLGVSKDTIYRWISTKQMPAHKVGKLWKFKISEIDKWVTKGEAADK